jgi:hypothetical protein
LSSATTGTSGSPSFLVSVASSFFVSATASLIPKTSLRVLKTLASASSVANTAAALNAAIRAASLISNP